MTGYGSQALALKYLGVDFESYKVIEFDKSVIKSYNEIHNTNFIATDIKDVDKLECDHTYLNICTYSYPCQSISKAGKGEGMARDSGTRSALLWEVERILKNTKDKPQVLLMENVPDVIGTNNIDDFKEWLEELEKMGYSNYVQLMNGKDYGIPQNRNRAFMVSIMGDYNYTFPSKIKLDKRLKDYLEDEVDDKYYLSDKMLNGMRTTKFESYKLENKIQDIDGISNVVIARFEGTPMCIAIPRDNSTCKGIATNESTRWQKKPLEELSRTILSNKANGGVGVIIPQATKQGYALAKDGDGVYLNRPHQKRGTVQNGMIQTIKANGDDIGVIDNMRIRKLTPKECFRLMGVKDSDSSKLTCSNSKKYHLAGNSIITTCLMAIFGQLLGLDWKPILQKTIEEIKEVIENDKV